MQVVKVQKRKIVLNFVIIVLCIGIGWYLKAKLTPQSNNMALAGGSTPHVLVEEVIKTDVSPQRKYIASVEAIKSVDLIPQVSGYVDEVLFQEGSVVKEGDILFVIEQDRYIANVDLSQAALDSAKANLVKTERDYKRQKALSSQQYASKSTLDTAESAYLQAKAAVESTIKIMKDALKKGDKVVLSNFGTFKTKESKPISLKNPKTGKEIPVPAKTRIRFKASENILK